MKRNFSKKLAAAVAFIFVALAPATAFATVERFTTSGTWSVPANVYSVLVEAWGGGGAGGGSADTGAQGAGGGGGGEYRATVVSVTPSSNIQYTIGAGGIADTGGAGGNGGTTVWNLSTSDVVAIGGTGGGIGSPGSGGPGGTGGTGSYANFDGGDGAAGGALNGGGGGESATSTEAGNDASGVNGGTGAGGTDGAAGGATTGNQGASATGGVGAGGGGSGKKTGGNESGGDGLPGAVRITYTANTPPTISPNTADEHDFGADATPTLEFTGSDGDGDDLVYEIEISSEEFGFVAQGATSRSYVDVAVDSSNQDVYAVVANGDIYKQTGGTGSFVSQGASSLAWRGIGINSATHDVYAVVNGGDIYKQTGGTGSFVAEGVTSRTYWDVAIDSSNNNVYVSVDGGDIYKQTGGAGAYNALGQTSRKWFGIAVDSSNQDAYASDNVGNSVYKQALGSGDFDLHGAVSGAMAGVDVDSTTHDVFVAATNIYKQAGGTGSFTAIATNLGWEGVSVDSSNGNVYSCILSDDVYKYVPPRVSAVSDAESGFANTVTGGDTSPFNDGEKVSFTVPSNEALGAGTYNWRVRTKDPSGTNTWSSYTTVRTFTTTASQLEPATSTKKVSGGILKFNGGFFKLW
jgi:hypothetical protein